MTVRIGVRRIVLFSAAACLLLASSHTIAQAPPATSDAEQRLKALEDKMDRVLKLLEPQKATPPTPQVIERQMDLITKAKDELFVKFEKAREEYTIFRNKSPFPNSSAVTQRLAKDEAVLLDLQQRQSEVDARSALVKNVGDNENQARALLILLQRRGVDVELLRRTATPGRDEAVTAVALVRLYGESLRLETEETKQLIQVAQGRIDESQKIAREMNLYQVTEDRLRTTMNQCSKLYDALVQQLGRMDAMQDVNQKH
jgi:hypothetical protein